MFEWVVATFSDYPYLGIATVFLFCGIGLPLPEEIVLISAGYFCFREVADLGWMITVCSVAILIGDIIPFALGRYLGASLLRLRPMRMLITRQRLARFDLWFSRRGDLVIFISRFIAGIRVVTFFTAGTMKTSWLRFIVLDALGIVLIAPLLVWVGARFGGAIDDAIAWVTTVERGILAVAAAIALVVATIWALRRRRRQRLLVGNAAETFVEPSEPIREPAPPPPDSSGLSHQED